MVIYKTINKNQLKSKVHIFYKYLTEKVAMAESY